MLGGKGSKPTWSWMSSNSENKIWGSGFDMVPKRGPVETAQLREVGIQAKKEEGSQLKNHDSKRILSKLTHKTYRKQIDQKPTNLGWWEEGDILFSQRNPKP